MAVSKHVKDLMSGSSFIREMFETGARMKAEYGADNVYDFTLGNPNLSPVEDFRNIVKRIIDEDIPGKHGYMPNAGYPFVRRAVAEQVGAEQKTPLNEKNIIMTCGAGGGMNAVFKSILNPGDRVLVSAPCFMEYRFYADNHGGKLDIIQPTESLELDTDAFERAIDKDVAAVIINSPNNPSGKIYSEERLKTFCEMLERASAKTGRSIYLVCDEPYRKIVYDGNKVPAVFPLYRNSIAVTSYSKDLSLSGERIGYAAINSEADDFDNLVDAIILCNRILGFVNAPALMQRAVAELQGRSVDINEYHRKRELLSEGLAEIGYEFDKPAGTFYLFPKAPGGDDSAFVQTLLKERILVVPGSGFAMPGFFRIVFCVEDKVIKGAFEGFKRAFEQMG